MASVNGGGTVKLWDMATLTELRTIADRGLGLCAVTFSPDSTRVITGGAGETKVWEIETGREVATLLGDTDTPGGIGLIWQDPDTLLAATALGFRLLHAPDFDEIRSKTEHHSTDRDRH